tara:strand:+ start:1407 stop:1745 length:339 start_codon:yes stop_codon:yes gene_type:complete
MRDKTIPDPENRKKFMFYDTPDRQARLKIRCKYDGINQSQFFRYMITGYLEMDPSIIKYLDHCKEKYGGQGIQKRKKITKMHSKAEFKIKKFSLDEGEIENIFDIIEADTTI